MNSRKQTINILIILLLITVLLAACSGGKKTKQGSPDVYLGGDMVIKDKLILLKGESNLLEGSRLTGQVIAIDGAVLSDTSEVVDKKGDFTMELDHQQFGEAEVVVSFDSSNTPQEANIVEHYGVGGAKLEGPYSIVTDHWDVDQINRKAEIRLTLTADNDITKYSFEKPEWDKKLDDYGEPRVWFELDEIKNDNEYFYLSGKTNLLEGSQISGSYSNGSDSANTRINPDGSFNLEIEYKYSEDPYFTLRFNPSNQWASIRDNYGFEGEKLVGKNIAPSGNYLLVEEIINYKHE